MAVSAKLYEHEHPILMMATLWFSLLMSLIWVGTASILVIHAPQRFEHLFILPAVFFIVAVDVELIARAVIGKPVEVNYFRAPQRGRKGIIIHAPWKSSRYLCHVIVGSVVFFLALANVSTTLEVLNAV